MPLDPSIYSQVGKVNLGTGIADELNQFTQQRAAQEDRQNRLAQLAMQMQEHQAKQAALASLPPEAQNKIRLGMSYKDIQEREDFNNFINKFNNAKTGVPAPIPYAQGDPNAPPIPSNAVIDTAVNPTAALPTATANDQGIISSGLAQPQTTPLSPEQKNDLITKAILSPNPHLQKGGNYLRMGNQFQETQDAKVLAAQQQKEFLQAMQNNAIANRPDVPPIQTADKNGNVTLWDRQGNKIKDLGAVGKPLVSSGVASLSEDENSALFNASNRGLVDITKVPARSLKTVAQAFVRNPDTNLAQISTDLNTTRKTESAFAAGVEARQIRSQNVALSHLDYLDKMTVALQNNDIPLFNKIRLAYQQATGNPAPTNFDGVKQMAMGEVDKAIIGGQNAEKDREETKNSMRRSGSPEQLLQGSNNFRTLLGGQLKGLHTQFVSGSPSMSDVESHNRFMKKLDLSAQTTVNRLIDEENAQRKLQSDNTGQPASAPAGQPASAIQQPKQNIPAGWVLHTDAKGNKAYVSPDGKQFQEVK